MSQKVMPPVEGGGFERGSEVFSQSMFFDEHDRQQHDARHDQDTVTDSNVHGNGVFDESEELHSACFF